MLAPLLTVALAAAEPSAHLIEKEPPLGPWASVLVSAGATSLAVPLLLEANADGAPRMPFTIAAAGCLVFGPSLADFLDGNSERALAHSLARLALVGLVSISANAWGDRHWLPTGATFALGGAVVFDVADSVRAPRRCARRGGERPSRKNVGLSGAEGPPRSRHQRPFGFAQGNVVSVGFR